MNNLLTKICNYVDHLLTGGREPIQLINALEHNTAVWDEATVVSSSVDTSAVIESQQPLPEENKENEQDFIFKAFKELTPEYLLVISEMRNLLNSDTKKIIFHALATKLSVDDVAEHLGITPEKMRSLFLDAIMDIRIQSGFVREYLNERVKKEMNIKASLLQPLTECLDLEMRTLNIFKALDIYTLEDLLRFTRVNGLSALTKQRRFGDVSLMRLENELIRKGIFEKGGHCELYKYITLPEQVKTKSYKM